jgi:DNA-binding SARP family transcriptional activator
MLFRVLGTLEASVGGRWVALGKSRQLTVLALLLLHANRSVSIDRLVEGVWNGIPPKTATEQIQTCVWRLRRRFAQDSLIGRTASGYVLNIPAERVDVGVFERLVVAAEIARTAGDNTAAISGYRAALRLFRGPVLAEIDSAVVRATAATWHERRLAVLEKCVELELDSGTTTELVAELTALVAENPLRERLRCQLMLALSGDDRRAEALATYREGRSTMVTELGLEPGPPLRELQRAILAGESTRPVALVPPDARVPAQLPTDIADFVGREQQLAQISRLLSTTEGRGGVRICALLGRCGAGKTALAVHVAHQLRRRFPDGQLYADLSGRQHRTPSSSEVLCGFLRALGYPDRQIPTDLLEQAALYRSAVVDRRMLVVLDDVADAAQAQQLLPAGRNTGVLLTSRTNLTDLPGIDSVEVEALTEDEATGMFRTVVGIGRCEAEPESMREIVRAAGRLPLSVRSASARLAAQPYLSLARFATQLSDPDRRLDELAHGVLDVRTSLARSEWRLTARTRDIWWRLGLLPEGEFPARTAAVAGDVALPLAEKLLDFLVDHRLVEVVGMDSAGDLLYRLDDASKLYAMMRAREELPEPMTVG